MEMIKYTCKCCEELTDAIDMETIIRDGKLCWKCIKLTDEEQTVIRKRVYGKKHELVKPVLVKSNARQSTKKRKGKVKRIFNYVCNTCTHTYNNFKPYACDKCNGHSFHSVEVTKH